MYKYSNYLHSGLYRHGDLKTKQKEIPNRNHKAKIKSNSEKQRVIAYDFNIKKNALPLRCHLKARKLRYNQEGGEWF